jgi:hypothetical protein
LLARLLVRILHRAVAAKAETAKESATSQLQTTMAAHEAAIQAVIALGLKPRSPFNLPTHDDGISPPVSPTKLGKPKVQQYVTKPKIKRNDNEWYQMIGTEKEAELFYKKSQANMEALPVGEVIRNAVKYHKFNQPCTANQALAWAQLDDLSTGYTGDLNSYNPKTHMLHIELVLVHPDDLPTDALEWPNWLETTTIDLDTTNYPLRWLVSANEIPVSLKTILKTCDANMHTVITDALHGTTVVSIPDVGTHPDSVMLASWVGKTTTEENFLSPGAETKVQLLPQEDYGINESAYHQGDDKGYAYNLGGETRYIQSFGSMKDYNNANTDHQKRVKKMGFEKEYFIPNLPLYMYEIAKFRWVPSPKNEKKDGYYEGMAHIRKADGQYTYVRVSLLTKTMEKLLGAEADSEFIGASKSKAIKETFTTRYRFVAIPPGDSREKLRKEKRELATQVLLEAEDEESKQAAVHPPKRREQESPLVSDARATLLAVDAPPPQELCTTVRIKYRQTEVLTCLIDSFCSVIWEFGLCDAAEGLQQEHRTKLSQSNYWLIADWIDVTNKHYLNKRQLVIQKLHLRQVDEVLAWDTTWQWVVLLGSSDGGVGQHAVMIYEEGIYERSAHLPACSCTLFPSEKGSVDSSGLPRLRALLSKPLSQTRTGKALTPWRF